MSSDWQLCITESLVNFWPDDWICTVELNSVFVHVTVRALIFHGVSLELYGGSLLVNLLVPDNREDWPGPWTRPSQWVLQQCDLCSPVHCVTSKWCTMKRKENICVSWWMRSCCTEPKCDAVNPIQRIFRASVYTDHVHICSFSSSRWFWVPSYIIPQSSTQESWTETSLDSGTRELNCVTKAAHVMPDFHFLAEF